MDTFHSKADWKGSSSSHPTTSATIMSSNKIPNAVSPYQTRALLLPLIEVAKYMNLGPHSRCKEQPPLAEDLLKKNHSVVGSKLISRWSGSSSPNPKVECLIDDRG
jgi:hypothetical protein